MLGTNILSDILFTLDKEYDFGLDIRLLRETIEEVNKKLEEIGVFIRVVNTGNGYVLKDKTVITTAKVILVFFNPNKKSQFARLDFLKFVPEWLSVCKKYELGVSADKIGVVLDDVKKILSTYKISMELLSQTCVMSFVKDPEVLLMDTDIVFKK